MTSDLVPRPAKSMNDLALVTTDRPATKKEIQTELLACLALVAPTTMTADERHTWMTVAGETLVEVELTVEQLRAAAKKARATCRFPSEIVPAIYASTAEPSTRYISDSGYIYRGTDHEVMHQAEQRADWNTYWSAKAKIARDKPEERSERTQAIGQIVDGVRKTLKRD